MKQLVSFLSMVVLVLTLSLSLSFSLYGEEVEVEEEVVDSVEAALGELATTGLDPEIIEYDDFHKGVTPRNFEERSGAVYKPSYNEEPNIPAQCWIETGYGTQNACLFCHSDYLSRKKHGNNYPIADDQVLYSFPTPDLNKVLWRNTIYPQEITARLEQEGIAVPDAADVAYMRQDNWKVTYDKARPGQEKQWHLFNGGDLRVFPALNPAHLYPEVQPDPTDGNSHGYVDSEGFVRNEQASYTGWRAVNFFPYGIFSPLTGSVSGIYLRLPEVFRTSAGIVDVELYKQNLDILERNIKNRFMNEKFYVGDAVDIPVEKGMFPVGTEFAHPLHYVDLNADGEKGDKLDGVADQQGMDYEFPGTRSKRVKEIRYMYKWKSVEWEDLDEEAHPDGVVFGNEGQGWIDNNLGWILAGYIEDRKGNLRTQTTEELMQCLGCHGMTGNTVDSVWSFPRKLPGKLGWREMDYGAYQSDVPEKSMLRDYQYENELGEMGFFYKVVVGADLFGVMPQEVADTLKAFAAKNPDKAVLDKEVDAVLDDSLLTHMPGEERKLHLTERQKLMRSFVDEKAYLAPAENGDDLFILGRLLYPTETTMKTNLQLYRQIVLDQSFNLGKEVFGSEEGHVPFTFRSDGSTKNAQGEVIPLGEIISSRPFDEDGEGTTPTGIVAVDEDGEPVDAEGNAVDMDEAPEKIVGHISTGGSFEPLYNPILSDKALIK